MPIKPFRSRLAEIRDHVYALDLGLALDASAELAAGSGDDNLQLQFNAISSNYELILDYLKRGTIDAQRTQLYERSARQIMDFTDRLQLHQMARDTTSPLSIRQRVWQESVDSHSRQLEEVMAQLLAHHQLEHRLPDQHREVEPSGSLRRDEILGRLFNLCWLSPVLDDELAEGLQRLLQDGAIPEEEQALLASSLNLGLLISFSSVRIRLQLELLRHSSPMVRARALTGVIQTIHHYHRRFRFYPELAVVLRTMLVEVVRKEEMEIILLQMIRSQDTDAITKRLREEIIPEMIRITPRITEHLDSEEFSIEDFGSEENPDWQEFFGDSPELMDKIQQLNEMQMDGSDVFMSAFAMLKQFPFFQEVHHWFLPFTGRHPAVQQELHALSGRLDAPRLLEGLSSSSMLCNSDKYSFLLNLGNLPDQQLAIIDRFFSAEMEMMREVQDEEQLLDDLSRFRSEARMYIQDLFRFHRLHPMRSSLPDLFRAFLSLHHTSVLGPYLRESGLMRTMAEFHFTRGHYEQASGLFAELAAAGDTSYEVFEKAGFAFQKIGHFEMALSYYRKAELYDTNRQWLLRKMAYCLRQLGRPGDAVPLYREAIRDGGEEERLMMQLANTLLEAGKFNEALNQYLGIELKYPSNTRILRPMAWCLLNTGKADKAAGYLESLGMEQWTRHDRLNLGHCRWILGDAAQ
ncbi:MAG TPA: tetratricopeptide repeat protein, partial [Bacteroidales bacterium]|nr:tetratricopeptide repeat protein [Bacteroidales bacterium]